MLAVQRGLGMWLSVSSLFCINHRVVGLSHGSPHHVEVCRILVYQLVQVLHARLFTHFQQRRGYNVVCYGFW